jgi:hypothetical protein
VGLGVADARYRRHGVDLRLLVARVAVEGADQASVLSGESIGRAMQGWYGEAAYDLLRRDTNPDSRRSLWLFARYERFDTNREMPDGYSASGAADRRVVSGGLSFMPIEAIAFKADVEHWRDDSTGPDSRLNRVNLGAAFMF